MKLTKALLAIAFLFFASLTLMSAPVFVDGIIGLNRAQVLSQLAEFAALEIATALVFVGLVLIHGLLAMTAKDLRANFGQSATSSLFIEAPLPFVALVFWLQMGFINDALWTSVFLGVLLAVGLVLTYGTIRVLDKEIARLCKDPDLWALARGGSDFARAKTYVYQLRLCQVAISFVAASAVVLQADNDIGSDGLWPAAGICIVFLGLAAVLLGYASWRATQDRLKLARTRAPKLACARIEALGISIAHYISSPGATKYQSSHNLMSKLEEEGVEHAVFVREAKARDSLIKARPAVISFIPTIRDLDGYATNALKTILYVNDAAKNGHFTRFMQYKHVLVASGALLNLAALPRSLEIYDWIVAPSRGVAQLWTENASSEISRRIVCVDADEDTIDCPHEGVSPVANARNFKSLKSFLAAIDEPSVVGGTDNA